MIVSPSLSFRLVHSLAAARSAESLDGTEGIERGILSIVPAATQIGTEAAANALLGGAGTFLRGISSGGANAAEYRYANKHWAEKIYIPTDLIHNSDFVVRSHPAVLDGFVSFFRKAVQALNLFGAEHCVGDRAEQDYTGKVLVLSPDTLKESCWSQENQLWYAHDGFGCSPHAIGRSVRCTCLSDGEMTRWNRNEFIGVLDDKFLPEWAKPKLAELQAQEQTDAPTMGGMNMK